MVTSTSIHPTAIIADSAQLGVDVEIGPYSIVGDDVSIGDRCRLDAHANLQGPLEVGPDCRFGPGTTIGHDPQVKGDDGPFGATRIGARTVFREGSQVHRSRYADQTTIVGDDCYVMAGAHVAHDCILGDNVTLCNLVLLAGHVEIESAAFLSGGAAVHQFCRIGTLAMVGGAATIVQDVAPYGMVVGNRPTVLRGLNVVGLRRAGIDADGRRALKAAYKTLFLSEAPVRDQVNEIEGGTPEVDHLLTFIRESKRGITRHRPKHRDGADED